MKNLRRVLALNKRNNKEYIITFYSKGYGSIATFQCLWEVFVNNGNHDKTAPNFFNWLKGLSKDCITLNQHNNMKDPDDITDGDLNLVKW